MRASGATAEREHACDLLIVLLRRTRDTEDRSEEFSSRRSSRVMVITAITVTITGLRIAISISADLQQEEVWS